MVFEGESYWIGKFVFQRGVALVYFTAFLIAFKQSSGLLGENGILPIEEYVEGKKFRDVVSIFYFFQGSKSVKIFSVLGIVLSFLSFLGVPGLLGTSYYLAAWSGMWVIFLSLKNVGQKFYLSGNSLLEAGFLSIFLGPLNLSTPLIMVLLVRWFLFRMVFGSGLCKIRNSNDWINLNSLNHFFETQSAPNPLSWYFHHLPSSFKKLGAVFTHFSLLLIPFLYFVPQPWASIAGVTTIAMQILLMLSGNFYWLNILTIATAFMTLSDSFWISLTSLKIPEYVSVYPDPSIPLILGGIIAVMSLKPTYYLLTTKDFPSTSYSLLRLVNTYGRYPEVPEERAEIIIEGYKDGEWTEYIFQQKPGPVDIRPPQVAPYNHKLDDVFWLVAQEPEEKHEWIEKLVKRLLEGEEKVEKLFREVPVKEPEKIRIRLFQYRFTTQEERTESGDWWRREPQKTLFEKQ